MKRNLFFAGIIILASLLACEKSNVPGTVEPEKVQVNEVLNLTPDFIGSVKGAEAGQSYETGDSLTLELIPGETLMQVSWSISMFMSVIPYICRSSLKLRKNMSSHCQ